MPCSRFNKPLTLKAVRTLKVRVRNPLPVAFRSFLDQDEMEIQNLLARMGHLAIPTDPNGKSPLDGKLSVEYLADLIKAGEGKWRSTRGFSISQSDRFSAPSQKNHHHGGSWNKVISPQECSHLMDLNPLTLSHFLDALSVAAGIPDFRTPGTGLYDNLKEYQLEQPEDIFSIE